MILADAVGFASVCHVVFLNKVRGCGLFDRVVGIRLCAFALVLHLVYQAMWLDRVLVVLCMCLYVWMMQAGSDASRF